MTRSRAARRRARRGGRTRDAGAGRAVPQHPRWSSRAASSATRRCTWGFKESFRAYIDGDIANGEWTTADGATYETPEFTWSGGTGRYDPETGLRVRRSSPGSVRFTGHDGLLDTTIADPAVSISRDGAGRCSLDVVGSVDGGRADRRAGCRVRRAAAASRCRASDARARWCSDPVLTADGEAAFPDYQAGTAFDPGGRARLDRGQACRRIRGRRRHLARADAARWVIAGGDPRPARGHRGDRGRDPPRHPSSAGACVTCVRSLRSRPSHCS